MPVVVLLDHFYLANTPYVRELVAAQLQQQGIRDFDYQVVGVEELEEYLFASRELGLAKVLQQKMSAAEHRWYSGAYLEFGQFMETIAPGRRRRSPLLVQVWVRLFEELRDRFPELAGVSTEELLGKEA